MNNRFPLYRLFLKLYPRQYREEFADQMLQTLADMLDDQPERSSRIAIWLRVSAELPFAVIQQSFNSLGDSSMKKLTKISNKRLLLISFALLLLSVLALGFIFRGAIRTNLLPNAVSIVHKRNLDTILEDQNKRVGHYFIDSNNTKKLSECYLQYAQGFQTEIGCTSTYNSYNKLPQTEQGRVNTLANVADTETALKAEGYRAGTNGMTLTSLIGGTYKGKDYSPDAFYERVFGSYDCVYDTFIAYASPQSPAITSTLSCTRTFDILGKPAGGIYSSSTGLQGIR